jgi:hypothetical protein
VSDEDEEEEEEDDVDVGEETAPEALAQTRHLTLSWSVSSVW